ncbi:MAG TPA: hypothetical protein VEF34_06075 [Syntrophobacteraceae bacterium]|nr:hypothetical protein [Syntrophobacteraceae bacterium]
MRELRYTLMSDGSSDNALLPILSWVLLEQKISCPIQSEWADLRRLPVQLRKLTERIENAVELFPCDLLFVHRDAESRTYQERKAEILKALEGARSDIPAVCVVPVRMQEAWLLFDENAVRRAAGNPNGRQPLCLPETSRLEQLPDPKETLYGLLKQASGLSGRRLKNLRINKCANRVSGYVYGFQPLRVLPAFRALEAEVGEIVENLRWSVP